MDTAFEFTTQDLLYIALIGAGVGLLLGSIPLILAIMKGRLRLGLLSIVISTLAGAFAPPLSIVVVAAFVWLILRKRPNVGQDDEPSSTSNSTPS